MLVYRCAHGTVLHGACGSTESNVVTDVIIDMYTYIICIAIATSYIYIT